MSQSENPVKIQVPAPDGRGIVIPDCFTLRAGLTTLPTLAAPPIQCRRERTSQIHHRLFRLHGLRRTAGPVCGLRAIFRQRLAPRAIRPVDSVRRDCQLCEGTPKSSRGTISMPLGRKMPTAGFRITVALVVVILGYPLSFVPAFWFTSRTKYPHPIFESVYLPLCWCASKIGYPAWHLLVP